MPQVHKMAKFTTWATCLQAILDTLVAAGWELYYDFRPLTPPTIANSTVYAVGDIVCSGSATYNGLYFICTVAGTSASNAATAMGCNALVSVASGTATFMAVSRHALVVRCRMATNRPWIYCYFGATTSSNTYTTVNHVMCTAFDVATPQVFFGRIYGWGSLNAVRTVYTSAGTYYTDIFAELGSFYIQLADTSNPSNAQYAMSLLTPEVECITDTVFVTTNALAGSNVTVSVTDSSQFIPGKYYRYLWPDGKYREKIQITSCPTKTSIVIAVLRADLPEGAFIGSFPFTSMQTKADSVNGDHMHIWDNSTNTDINTATDAPSSSYNYMYAGRLLSFSNVLGNYYNSKSGASRVVMYTGVPNVPIGFLSDMFLYLDFGTCGDQFGSNEYYRGSAGSATDTSITDNNANWTVNEHVGKRVVLTSGTGAGQSRRVVSNTGNTLYFDTVCPWATLPINGTMYSLVFSSYRRVRTVQFGSAVALRENN